MDLILIDGYASDEFPNPYLGLLSIRNVLQKEFDVEIIKARHSRHDELKLKNQFMRTKINELANSIVEKKPAIVGFYTLGDTFIYSIQLAAEIKRLNSEIKIMLGGPHASITAEECISEFPFVDVIALGEAELYIVDLVNSLLYCRDLKNIPNICFMYDGSVYMTEKKELIPSKELYKYTPYNLNPYISDDLNTINLEGGRGCPYSCTFCSTNTFWGRMYRVKQAKKLVNEMIKYSEIYDVCDFQIIHDNLTSNRQYIKELCQELIEIDSPFTWSCSSRIDTLDNEIILLLKESNCRDIFIGIETGSKRMQKLTKKNVDLDVAMKTIKCLIENDYSPTFSFVYGFPEETLADFRETTAMIGDLFRLGIEVVQCHFFMVYPETIETNKVFDKLYLDFSKTCLTNVDEDDFDQTSEELIRKYPNLFTKYYTFDTDVRNKYLHFEMLVILFATSLPIFKYNIAKLLENNNMIEIYDQNYDLVLSMYNLKMYKNTNQEFNLKCFKIMEELSSRYTADFDDKYATMLTYYSNIITYMSSKSETPQFYHYKYDVKSLEDDSADINMPTGIILLKSDGKVKSLKVAKSIKDLVSNIK